MQRILVNGIELAYVSEGSGSPVLFSHGLLFSHRMFEAQVSALSGSHRCVAYDHRGQGSSDVPPGRSISIEQVTDDAAALIEALDLAPCHFVGLSMGGFVGLRLAARRPELIRSLTILESTAQPEAEQNLRKYRALNLVARCGGIGLVVGRVMPIVFSRSFLNDPTREKDRQRWHEELAANRRTIFKAVNGVLERASVVNELAAIRVPTLVVVGEEDVATVPAKSERIAEGIEGARLVRIPEAGHSSPIEQPERVTEELRRFLAQVEAG